MNQVPRGGSRGKYRAAKPRMPSCNASSAPAETSSTRRPGRGRSRSAVARATSAATPDRLSLAPGTAGRRPMSTIATRDAALRVTPARVRPRRPVALPRATRAGPAITGHHGAQHADRPRVRAAGGYLFNGGPGAEAGQPVADQLGGLAFAGRGGQPGDRGELVDDLAQPRDGHPAGQRSPVKVSYRPVVR